MCLNRLIDTSRYPGAMPISTGFNHVATLSTDLDRHAEWWGRVFGAVVTFTMDKQADHPRMFILDVGGGAALNVFEVSEEEIIGERRRQGGRGAIDHFAIAVDSRDSSRRSSSDWSTSAPTSGRSSARIGVVAVLPRRRRHGVGSLRAGRLIHAERPAARGIGGCRCRSPSRGRASPAAAPAFRPNGPGHCGRSGRSAAGAWSLGRRRRA